MVKTDLKYTYIAKGRYWRFRHPKTGDCALPGAPGDAAFHEKYGQLVAAVQAAPKAAVKTSFDYLIDRYLKSAEYRALSDATQLDYGKTCAILKDKLGKWPFALTTRNMIKAVRDHFADTPRKAHKIKQMVSCLYSWADDNDLVPAGFNPAKDLKKLKRKGGAREYTVWSEAEFQTFMDEAIPSMRTAAMMARYTGQRVQDVVKATWQDFQGTEIRVRQAKTGAPLIIACHSRLRDYLNDLKRQLDADKKRGVMILTSATGAAYNANSLSSAINREVNRIKAMPTDRSLHGLRYMAGSDMEEAGCTVAEIQSVLGHQAFQMTMKYASQRLRAKAAAEKREAV